MQQAPVDILGQLNDVEYGDQPRYQLYLECVGRHKTDARARQLALALTALAHDYWTSADHLEALAPGLVNDHRSLELLLRRLVSYGSLWLPANVRYGRRVQTRPEGLRRPRATTASCALLRAASGRNRPAVKRNLTGSNRCRAALRGGSKGGTNLSCVKKQGGDGLLGDPTKTFTTIFGERGVFGPARRLVFSTSLTYVAESQRRIARLFAGCCLRLFLVGTPTNKVRRA